MDAAAGRFVGRGALVDELRALAERAAAHRGAFVVVRGEAGVGKTSLVEHALGAGTILWGRCRERSAPPLWPWTQVARAARRAGVAGLDAFETPPPTGSPITGSSASGSGQDRFARFDQLTDALVHAAARTPFVVAVDDLQWADEESVELLSFVAADAGRTGLLVVATLRDGESAPSERLAELLGSTDTVSVELAGLGGADLAALLTAMLGSAPAPELLDAVEQHTGGNPLFVRETARLLRAAGTADRPGSWRGVLPEGVGAVLGRRLARLAQPVDRVVRVAAVVGTDVDAAVVAAIVEGEPAAVAGLLDAAADAGLLAASVAGRSRFAHALVREAALAGLASAERRELHRRTAEVLATRAGERGAAEIAEHHAAAGELDAARRWAAVAGRQAERMAMHADAAAWFERALGWGTLGEHERLTLLAAFAAAAARAGRHDDAAVAFAEVAAGARALGDPELFARAALGVGTVGGSFEVRVLDPAQVALLEEALARLDPGDSALRSWLLARLSVAATLVLDVSRRRVLADEAVAMARRLGDDAALAHALGALCDSHAGPADQPLRRAAADELIAAARRAADPELELLGRRLAIVALMEVGEVAVAERHVAAAAALAERLRQPQLRWFTRAAQGMLALLHGDLDAAQRYAESAAADGRAAGSANAEMVVDGALVPVVLRERGEVQRAADQFRDAVMRHGEASRGLDPTPAFMIDHLPDPDGLRQLAAAIPEGGIAGDDEAIFFLLVGYELLAVAATGDAARARRVATRLAPFAEMLVLDGLGTVCYGPVATLLGDAAALLGDVDAARARYAEALDVLGRMHAPRLVADVRSRVAALSVPSGAAAPAANELIRDGEVWRVAFAGRRATFADAKGLRDLAVLVGRPGREVHVLELVGASAVRPAGGADPVLDTAARRAYEQRVRDLTEDIDEAEANHDLGLAQRLDDERAALLGQLAAALGLGGRDRPAAGDPGERARKAVGMRIRAAIDRLDRELPDLGRHLRHAVRTGLWCAYEPERPTEWHVVDRRFGRGVTRAGTDDDQSVGQSS